MSESRLGRRCTVLILGVGVQSGSSVFVLETLTPDFLDWKLVMPQRCKSVWVLLSQ